MRHAVALAVMLACTEAYLPSAALPHASRQSVPAARAAVVLKKGRAQGGGPKISTRKKLFVSRVKRDNIAHQPQGPKKRMPSLSAKRQWDRHIVLLEAGVEPWTVCARTEDAAEWLEVGFITLDPAAPDVSAAGAVQLHKRLILKHASRLHPLTLGDTKRVNLGLRAPSEGEGGASEAEVQPFIPVPAAPREACGFSGKPDENSGAYFTDSTPIPAPGKAVKIGQHTKKDSKSATAEAFSKMLGLRN
jgi:hypothetical protein